MKSDPVVIGPVVKERSVGADSAGQRIDNFLLGVLKGVPRSRIYRALRSGEVRVNGGRVRAERRLSEGDLIRVPPIRVGATMPPVEPGERVRTALEAAILFEDAELLVLNKPSGIAVHGGSGSSLGVIEAIRILRPDARMLELVHRLDRDTSGVLLLAKRRTVLLALHELFRGNSVVKRYIALVYGQWPADLRHVDAPLHKSSPRSGGRMVLVSSQGKSARTRFSPLSSHASSTLLEAFPETGRTHQIRVHAQHAGHPIAGDDKYGNKSFNALMRRNGVNRLFLHCSSMTFRHPGGGSMTFSAPLPTDLAGFVNH